MAAVITRASTAAGIILDSGVLTAIDDALGDAPITQPTPALYVEPGVRHR